MLLLVRSIQAKTGVSEADLMCGIHTVYDRQTAEAMRERGEAPTPNRHNCSGKHTGMLAFSRMLGIQIDPDGLAYIDPNHPVQRKILAALAEMSDLRPGRNPYWHRWLFSSQFCSSSTKRMRLRLPAYANPKA